ncbi:MAG: hypothetical protein IT158_14445 [Bryobacterales bacterium]|nr:hypothetical protein [Bryobacterales bacterium]
MRESRFHNRRAVSIENDQVRVTVLVEGGHVAEICDKQSGVNPLWIPHWPSIEPSVYDPAGDSVYGADSESKLLAGIMGHNLCLDIFGVPSEAEAAAGLTVHGEGSVVPYRIEVSGHEMAARAELPMAGLRFERRLRLEGRRLRFLETVENLSAYDRPIGWTQHVTLGPPFLEKGVTEFRVTATRSKTAESDVAGGKSYMTVNAEFDWPFVPCPEGGTINMQVFTNAPVSGGYTAHLMDPGREDAFFLAYSPHSKVLFGYVWKRADFPWMGIWEENYSRESPPWNGKALTRGMEFGVSPMPETRRQMIERGSLFGHPTYRWIHARGKLHAEYWAFISAAEHIPEQPPAL